MANKRLLVFGNSYMDFTAKVKRAPERGETVLSNLDNTFLPGGYGVISAITSSKFGTDVIYCSRIGEDENGEKICNVLKEYNVDIRFLKSDKRKATGINFITVETGNKTRVISYPGANSSLSYDDIESAFMSYPDAVLLNFDLRHDFIDDVLKFASDSNVPLIISAGSEFNNYDVEDFPNLEIFCPNKETVSKITGIDPIDANTALHACVKLISKIKSKYIVIKLGARGCFVFDGVYSEIIPALDVTAVDTTMSGAIFTSALACKYLESNNINKAANFANNVASLSVSKYGTYNSLPHENEIIKH